MSIGPLSAISPIPAFGAKFTTKACRLWKTWPAYACRSSRLSSDAPMCTQTLLRGHLLPKENGSPLSTANTSVGRARISLAYPAKTSFTVRRSRRTFAEPKCLASITTASRLTCRGSEERKRKMVRGLNHMYSENYKNTGAEFILATGKFIAPGTVEVAPDDSSLAWHECDRQYWYAGHVGTDSRAGRSATAHPHRGTGTRRISRTSACHRWGCVGVELDQAMRRFGSEVTVSDRNERLMSKEDPSLQPARR
jgi:hypothetical protein